MSSSKELRESKDDLPPTSSPLLIPSDDEMKVVTSNMPDRTLTLLHILGQAFVIPPPLSRTPHSPTHRLPQHLHHAHPSESKEMTRSASPPPSRAYYGPLCSGWLWLQKTAGKWKRMWCEYSDGVITYRDDETSRKAKGSVLVTFIEAEQNPYRPQVQPTPPTLPISPNPTRQTSYHSPSPLPPSQDGEGHLLPASPVLTTSVSSPLSPSTTTRAQPVIPARPALTISTGGGSAGVQPGSAGGARGGDETLSDTLTRLSMSPAPQLTPSISAAPPSPSLFLASPAPPACFPQEDHEVLTSEGFKSFLEFAAAEKEGRCLLVACPVRVGLVGKGDFALQWFAPTALIAQQATQVVHFRSQSDDMDLLLTPQHRLLVKLGSTTSLHNKPWPSALVSAEEVLQATAKGMESVQFLCNASHGAVDSHMLLPFAAQLGLHLSSQQDAFTELYGYFLGSGRISSDGSLVLRCFSDADISYVQDLLDRVGLVLLQSGQESDIYGYRKKVPHSNSRVVQYNIYHPAWWHYFIGEYDEYWGDMGEDDSPDRTHNPDNETADPLLDTPSVSPGYSASLLPEDRENKNGHSKLPLFGWVFSHLSAARCRLLLRGLRFSDGNQEEEAEALERERQKLDNAHAASSAAIQQRIQSALGPHDAWPLSFAHITTTSTLRRDELERVCLHAGFTVTWTRNSTVAASWRVQYCAGTATGAHPTLSLTPNRKSCGPESLAINAMKENHQQEVEVHDEKEVRLTPFHHPVWCVSVPTEEQLIIVRRVIERAKDGLTALKASRPTIVGNSLDQSQYSRLYFSYLDTLEHPYTFKIYAPARVYYFRADTPELRQHFLSTIRTHLLSSTLDNNPLYTKKHLASLSLASSLHEQFMLQLHRYNLLVKALAKMTMEDELPITSTRKEYSGVLCMETMSEGTIKWRDYYFVLFEGALFYYKDSKSTTPTGFITLRYATITIDVSKMIRNDFVFHVITPLRTIACRTKHAVALAEWITALEMTLARHVSQNQQARDKGPGGASRERLGSFGGSGLERQVSGGSTNGSAGGGAGVGGSGLGERERSASDNGVHVVRMEKEKGKSSNVLQNINRFIAEVQSFNSLIQHPAGLEGFRKFLSEERERKSSLALDFYLATTDFINTQPSTPPAPSSSSSSAPSPVPPSPGDLFPQAEAIQRRFFTPESPDSLLPFLPTSLTAPFTAPLALSSAITVSLFDPLRKALSSLLTGDYHEFKRTADYEVLSSLLSSSSSAHSDDRPVDPFDSSSLQLFLLKVKGTKRSKEIKFNKKDTLWTIGRDKSNKLVIEDSRVSRSHARVEYSESACEYIDLGSSCGSKLNGKPVLRAKLKAGDVIELGQSTLIFQVKPKKRFRLFGGE